MKLFTLILELVPGDERFCMMELAICVSEKTVQVYPSSSFFQISCQDCTFSEMRNPALKILNVVIWNVIKKKHKIVLLPLMSSSSIPSQAWVERFCLMKGFWPHGFSKFLLKTLLIDATFEICLLHSSKSTVVLSVMSSGIFLIDYFSCICNWPFTLTETLLPGL